MVRKSILFLVVFLGQGQLLRAQNYDKLKVDKGLKVIFL
jgi:hypothetical protein